jgi:hypothetical protein
MHSSGMLHHSVRQIITDILVEQIQSLKTEPVYSFEPLVTRHILEDHSTGMMDNPNVGRFLFYFCNRQNFRGVGLIKGQLKGVEQ